VVLHRNEMSLPSSTYCAGSHTKTKPDGEGLERCSENIAYKANACPSGDEALGKLSVALANGDVQR